MTAGRLCGRRSAHLWSRGMRTACRKARACSRHQGRDNETWNCPDAGAKAGLLNDSRRRGTSAPIARVFARSGNRRWGARLRVGAGPDVGQAGSEIEPGHPRGRLVDRDRGGLWHIERRAGLQHAAD